MRKLLLLLFVVGCTTIKPNVKENLTSPSPILTIKPTSPATPSVTITSSPISTATPIPSQANSDQIKVVDLPKKNKLTLGISNVYKIITSNLSTDYQKDARERNEYINELKPSYVILDLNQKLINPDLDAKNFNWNYYDKVVYNIKDSNVAVFFRINFDQIYDGKSSPTLTNYQTFLETLLDRYKDYNISFIVGDKLNDQNNFSGKITQRDFVNFLASTYNIIKYKDKTRSIYLGSFEQSEFFGSPNNKMVEDLLTYINMGVMKYSEGIVFEIYNLAVNVSNDSENTILNNTNYRITFDYYKKITDLLKQRNIENKKLILSTGTFGGNILQGVSQNPQQQANEIIRQIVYSTSIGFDNIYLPNFLDSEVNSNIFKNFGLINTENDEITRKTAYWTTKFVLDKLKNTTSLGQIANLPKDYDGFIFQKDDMRMYYVLWNNNEKLKDNLKISLGTKSAKLYVSPSDDDRLSTPIGISADDKGFFNISFNSNNLNPRIIEVVK